MQYDALGRQREIGKTIHGHSGMLTTAFDYDQAGRLTGMTYPDGYQVAYTYYYKTSRLHEVLGDNRALVSYSQLQPFGAAGQVDYGNNVADVYTFDQASGRLLGFFTDSAAGASGGNLQKLLYDYSPAGDVKTITDRVRGVANTFAYDELHRLTGELASGAYTTGARNVQLAYYGAAELPAPGRTAHAPKSATLLGQTYTYVYDANGNMTRGFDFSDPTNVATRDIVFDASNMPVQINHARNGITNTTQLTYDGEGKRAVKVAPSGNTYYYGSHFIVDKGVNVRYILAGSSRVIMQRQNAPGSPFFTTSYIHKDHLGSTSLITNDTDGGWEEKGTYQAYGLDRTRERQPTAPENDYRYTGQEQDPEAGLYNYNARLYDPAAGIFITADSIVPDYADPQSLNRYMYARGNPLFYTDPSGHHFLGDVGEFFDDTWEGIKENPIRAVVSFAASAFFFYGAGELGGGIINHMFAGAASGGVKSAIYGEDIGRGMLTGGFSGGVAEFIGPVFNSNGFLGNLAGRTAAGGITGGLTSAVFGGSFADGFRQGAMTGAAGYIFNELLHPEKIINAAKAYVNKGISYQSGEHWAGGSGVGNRHNGALVSVDCSHFVNISFCDAGECYSWTSTGGNWTAQGFFTVDLSLGPIKASDILLWSSHVGIVQDPINQIFIGSQTSTGPAQASFAPGSYWGNKPYTILRRQ